MISPSILDSPKKPRIERSASEQRDFDAEVKSVARKINFERLVVLAVFFWGDILEY